MRLGLTISRLAVVVVCNLVIRSSAEPSFDSKFSASDLSTLQQLLLQYSAKLGAADWKGAWSLLAPNAKVTFTNKLLGGSPETASTQAQFVAIYKKASFDGKLVQSLSKATLLSTSPFSVQLDGTISTDKGPLPNTPATFLTKWVFSGNHPGPGQIVFADDQIVSLASSDPTPNAQTSSPSSSSSTSQVPPPPRPNQSPARATSVPGATALSAPVQNSSPARVAPVASAAISAPSALVPAATSGTMQASPSTASIDSRIAPADQITLQSGFADFASKIASGRFADAWTIFAPNVRITAKNQLLGDSDTITDRDGFVKYYTKNSYGGQLKLGLSSITLKAATPYTISVTGTITLTSGPLPNTPIDFSATYTFSGSRPVFGQIQSLDQIVVGISKGAPPSGAVGGSPSLGAAGGSIGGFAIPNFHEIAGSDIGGITGILLKYGSSMQSGNYFGAYDVFGPQATIVFQNDLTGGAVEYLRNAQEFAFAFRKSSFGGRLRLKLTDVYRLRAPTFSIGLRGWVMTNAGPTANLPITFWAVITFSGSVPQAGQIRYYSIELQGLADGSQLASHIPGIRSPQIDPRIRPVDAVRIEGLLLQFGQQVQAGNFGAAYDLLQPGGYFGGVTQIGYENDVTGGEILNLATRSAFISTFQQSTYGGRLSQTLTQIRLGSTYPLVYIFYGLLSTTAGPTANAPIRYSCTVTFRGRQAIAGQIQSFYLNVESFADGSSVSRHVGITPPYMDPAISFHDSVRIEGLILSFGQRILQRDYVGAYNVFGRNYIAENKNDLLNTQDSSQNAYDYARAFDKNAFGGRVTTTLRSIHLVTQNPYTIVFQGQLQTTAGQAPNENLDYRSTLVFRGNSPHGGQVVRFSTEIIRFSDGSTPIGHVLNKVPLVGGLLHDLIP